MHNRLGNVYVPDLSAAARPPAQGFPSLIAAISVTSVCRCENEIRKSDTCFFSMIHKESRGRGCGGFREEVVRQAVNEYRRQLLVCPL